MSKCIYFVIFLSILLVSGCSTNAATYSPAPSKDIVFRFQKSLVPNKYYLTIKNRSPRTVEFITGDAMTTDGGYYIVAKNGAFVPIDAYGGFKGICWVSPGYNSSISFNIPKHLMKNAESIVFKGSTYISRIENSFQSVENEKEIIITYDAATKKLTAKDGEWIVRQPQVIFMNGGLAPGGYGQPLPKDDFSLRGGAQQGVPVF